MGLRPQRSLPCPVSAGCAQWLSQPDFRLWWLLLFHKRGRLLIFVEAGEEVPIVSVVTCSW